MASLSTSEVRRIPQVTVIGAGNVGSAVAKQILDRQLANVVLIDVVPGRPQGIALDLTQAAALEGHSYRIVGTNDYDDTAQSDVVVVTAGKPRTPGMSRDDLALVNGPIVMETVRQAIARSPQARLIMVTNPLDAMVYLAWQVSGLPPRHVMGMAGVLDTARFRTFIAMELQVPVSEVSALVLGGHGDLMVPLVHHASVAGIPVTQLLDGSTLRRLVERTQRGGAEIVNHLKTGGAHYAPGAAVASMVAAILRDRHEILPAAAYLQGEYRQRDIYVGVPCRLGASGVEAVLELPLTEMERAALQRSVLTVQGQVERVVNALIKQPATVPG
jgi:malate dehydrogenase